MTDSNCLFCKIANGLIPSYTVYEDHRFRVILDISPASKGHVIILPKNHAANIFELPEEDASQLFPAAKKIAEALNRVTECDGINILQNNGEAAGQSVYHLHVHVIPRYHGDTVNIRWTPGKLETEQAESLLEAITEAVLDEK